MATLLLVIIYLAFISLGLPDSLLGAAWPVMQSDLGVPLETAGLLFMVVASGTIVSSLISGKVLKRFGTGKVTVVSVTLTALALFGFSQSSTVWWLVLCALPLGLGAGAVDAGLNNYVAANYQAHHMSWLHCFWGIGATLGPIMMAQFIASRQSWGDGYLMIAGIQLLLVMILFFTLPLWSKVNRHQPNEMDESADFSTDRKQTKTVSILKLKGVNLVLISFLFYAGIEATVGLWGSSFLVNVKGLHVARAAGWVSLYYGGITIGRFITGFVTFKVGNRILIRSGLTISLIGSLFLLSPLPAIYSLLGFIVIGIGFAPIFPCMLHETPVRFGREKSQTIMGYQMGVAYMGTTFLPPFIGYLVSHTTLAIFPFCIVIIIVIVLLGTEWTGRLFDTVNAK